MAHLRQQIRSAIATALASGTNYGSVSTQNDRPVSETQAEAGHLAIHTRVDEPDYSQGQLSDGGGIPLHSLTVVIEGYYKAAAGASTADRLDAIAAEVETTLYATDFSALTVGLEVSTQTIESGADDDKPFGLISMSFIFFYFAQEGAPETAI